MSRSSNTKVCLHHVLLENCFSIATIIHLVTLIFNVIDLALTEYITLISTIKLMQCSATIQSLYTTLLQHIDCVFGFRPSGKESIAP